MKRDPKSTRVYQDCPKLYIEYGGKEVVEIEREMRGRHPSPAMLRPHQRNRPPPASASKLRGDPCFELGGARRRGQALPRPRPSLATSSKKSRFPKRQTRRPNRRRVIGNKHDHPSQIPPCRPLRRKRSLKIRGSTSEAGFRRSR